jgi:hypothetical protein
MTRLALWTLACALGIAGWVAIVKLLGWWVAGVIAYLAFLLVGATASIGGIGAALEWLERRRSG